MYCKHCLDFSSEVSSSYFHSLQTGKCIASRNRRRNRRKSNNISIPFKRESVLQALMCSCIARKISYFNSLQTGKCIASKKKEQETRLGNNHFHSLQTGKCIASCRLTRAKRLLAYFHSLQTGKCIASGSKGSGTKKSSKFPFPSNGKVYCKPSLRKSSRYLSRISIPFKRESVLQDRHI